MPMKRTAAEEYMDFRPIIWNGHVECLRSVLRRKKAEADSGAARFGAGEKLAVSAPLPGFSGYRTLTDAIKRYPRRWRVSIKRGVSAESQSAARSLFMARFRPRSKSTKVWSDQSVCRNSSRVTI